MFPTLLAQCGTGEAVLELCDETVMTEEWYGLAEQRLCALCPDYTAEIESWDWNGIVEDCAANEGACYLGSVLSLYPSGKVYAFWATNQSRWDEVCDEAFQEALETVAEKHGLYVGGSDGNGCDVFAYWTGSLVRVLSDGAQGIVLEEEEGGVRVMFAYGFIDAFQFDEVEIYERD